MGDDEPPRRRRTAIATVAAPAAAGPALYALWLALWGIAVSPPASLAAAVTLALLGVAVGWLTLDRRLARDAAIRAVHRHGCDVAALRVREATSRRAEAEADRQRRLAEALIGGSVDGVLAFDRDLTVTAWSASMERIFGVTAAEAVGGQVLDVLPCLADDAEHGLLRATLEGDAPHARDRPFQVPATGCAGHVDCHHSPLRDADGRIGGGLVVFRDRTRSREVAVALRDANELFSEVFEHAPTGMALIALDPVHGGSFLRVNRALCEITGHPAADLMTATVLDITDRDDALAELALTQRLLAGELPRFRLEKRFRRPDGSAALVAVSVALLRDIDGTGCHALVQVEDIAPLREQAERLRRAADEDAITGVCDRARFDTELRRQVADAARHGHPGAVLALDLDDVGAIDETLGDGTAEEVARDVARLLRNRLRETDVVARLGGDEFAVILRLAPLETAERVAAELVRHIGERVTAGGGARRVAVTASAGVAPIDADAGEPHDVLARANVARHEAKRGGRGMTAAYRGPGPGPGAVGVAGR
ncbi:MAG: hypothetical protein QOC64_2784 [Solirubrobacteraceae bacterium]|nr:hypothetical protein [Solirubrobacteraceae bacterium]